MGSSFTTRAWPDLKHAPACHWGRGVGLVFKRTSVGRWQSEPGSGLYSDLYSLFVQTACHLMEWTTCDQLVRWIVAMQGVRSHVCETTLPVGVCFLSCLLSELLSCILDPGGTGVGHMCEMRTAGHG